MTDMAQSLKTKDYPIESLIFAEYNPRQLTKDQYKNLKDSITRFGLVDPLIVNTHKDRKNILVGGHQRARVAKDLGFDKVPVVEVSLPLDQEKELNIRLNRNTGEWDYDALANYFDVGELTEWGFTDDELQFWEDEPTEGLIEDDEVPEVEEAVTKAGDLWILGEHRVLCGDATKKEDVERLMDGQKADMVFTDPPYSVNYTKKSKEVLKSKNYVEIKNDNLPIKETAERIWSPVFKNMYENSNDHCSFYMTMPQGGDQMMMMMMMMMGENWKVKHELIWVKDAPVFSMGRLDYDYKHEPIMYGWKKKHNFIGRGEYTKSVWEIKRTENKLHPTMKPVELIINAIKNSSNYKDNVIDYFLGSGSTLIACEKTNRKCYGMEIDPHYCDVIVKRWEDYTGNKAERIEAASA